MEQIDNLSYTKIVPIDGVGRFFNNQEGQKFIEYGAKEIFPEFPDYSVFFKRKIASNLVKKTRLIYIQISSDGVITTRQFEKNFGDAVNDEKWVIEKIKEIDKCPSNLLNYYAQDNYKCGVGLDQECAYGSLLFFYISNKANKFAGVKFSSVLVSRPRGGSSDNPFTIIVSSNSQLVALYNIHMGVQNPAEEYVYKFNLHLEAEALPGDYPDPIPWLIDPVVINPGPPA